MTEEREAFLPPFYRIKKGAKKMRKLVTADIMSACRCLKNIGIKEEIKKIAAEADTLQSAFDKGFELLWNIFDAATEKNAENYIYEFLAGPFEKTPDEIKNMEIAELFADLKQLAQENDLGGFFHSVGALMK